MFSKNHDTDSVVANDSVDLLFSRFDNLGQSVLETLISIRLK